METSVVYTPEDIQENKVMAFLAYLGLLVLVPLLAKKDSPFAQFHAKQGIVLLLAWVALSVIFIIPILGWIVGTIGYIVLLVFTIMGIINALSGNAKELPLIGQFSSKFNF
ncbi:MAG: DUF4870 domain-containing protein [Bacillota bacterium]